MRRISVPLVLLCGFVSACAAGRAHQNFKNHFQWDVGRSAEDPQVSFNYYREDRGPATVLPNGNSEQQYHFGTGCEVFFEIGKESKKIVGWRYEGTEETCVLVP